jgi:hypothetical protein
VEGRSIQSAQPVKLDRISPTQAKQSVCPATLGRISPTQGKHSVPIVETVYVVDAYKNMRVPQRRILCASVTREIMGSPRTALHV